MKANNAPDFPEKVYIPRDPEYPQSPNIWWERELSESNIEYTRTDVLIEKACSGIEKLLSGYIIRNFHFGDSYDIDRLIEDFKNYMEEE